MAMHGPHQGAQKSTTRGRPIRVKWRSKLAAVRAIGLPSNNGKRHLGQRGESFNRSLGMRTTESQCPQTTAVSALMNELLGLRNEDVETIGNDGRARMRLLLRCRRRWPEFRGRQVDPVRGRVE